MNKIDLSPTYSVSEQIVSDDIITLKDANVEVIICNRPDAEDPGQPDFELIAQAAEKAGMIAVNIPFSSGGMNEQHVHALVEILDTGKKIHAYCRSGNRSTQLWQVAQQH